MRIDTSKLYAVRDTVTQIDLKNFRTEKEAKDYAKFMTSYHRMKFDVVSLATKK